MPQVPVHKAEMPIGAVINPFCFEVEEILEAIRKRAFELFERRSGTPGDSLSDWLRAERELFNVPPAEISESPEGFTITMCVPGCTRLFTDVLVQSHRIVVLMESWRDAIRGKSLPECTCAADGSKPVYRRFELPGAIDIDTVKADLDKDVLIIRASRKAPVSQAILPSILNTSERAQVCPAAA